jgi:hypothetical protein
LVNKHMETAKIKARTDVTYYEISGCSCALGAVWSYPSSKPSVSIRPSRMA